MLGLTNTAFAPRIGKTAETVRRYRTDEREPDQETMRKIFAESDGLVTPNDFAGVGYRPEPPAASADEGALS